jgi:4'-phosphopantetheinyl transferase EntD
MDSGYQTTHGGGESGMGALLPAGIVVVEATGDVDPGPLLGDEGLAIVRAIERRQREFARGRTCARRALAILGWPDAIVLAADDRSPRWPHGATGSITHCRDYCAAAAGRAETWASIGIDAEVAQRLEPGVEERIVLPAERARFGRFDPALPWPCVVFSAKEALYKAVHPLTSRWLDFHDVELEIDPVRGAWQARILVDPPALPGSLEGQFRIEHGRVLSAIALAR